MVEYNEMEAYYEAMIENLAELEEVFEDGYPTDRIEAYIGRMTLKTYNYQNELNLPLYRARYDDGFNNTDPNQFGYIELTKTSFEVIPPISLNINVCIKKVEQINIIIF